MKRRPPNQASLPALATLTCLAVAILANFATPSSAQEAITPGPDSALAKLRAEAVVAGQGSAARVAAIEMAEKDALEIYAFQTVGETGMPHIASLLSEARRYVRSSRLLEYDEANGNTRVLVEVYLDKQPLDQAIAKAVYPHLPLSPTVVLLIGEEVAHVSQLSVGAVGIVEQRIAEAFAKARFTVVDGETVRQQYSPAELQARVENDALAGQLARETGAAIAIVGESFARPVADAAAASSNLLRVRATVALKIVRAADNAVLDTASSEAVVTAGSIADASRLALTDAADKLNTRLQVAAVLGTLNAAKVAERFALTLEAPGRRGIITQVAQTLQRVPGVNHVEILRDNPRSALLQFDYDGKVGALIDHLRTATPRIEPTHVIGRDMTFRLSP